MQTFDFGLYEVTVPPYAQIQTNTLKRVQSVFDQYDSRWFAGRSLFILEFSWKKWQGTCPVFAIEEGEEVRYGRDPMSRAKPHNQRPVPFVLRETAPLTKDISLYLHNNGGQLNLVRAHFGRPYPPQPFQGSAGNWPGHQAGLLELAPGRQGCLDYWRTHAYRVKKPDQFAHLDPTKPDWLN